MLHHRLLNCRASGLLEQNNAPELPIGRFHKAQSPGGNRVIVAVLARRATCTPRTISAPGGLEPPEPKVRQLAGEAPPSPLHDPCRLVRQVKQFLIAHEAVLPVGQADRGAKCGVGRRG